MVSCPWATHLSVSFIYRMSIFFHKAIAPELMADCSVTNRKFCDLFIRDQLGQKLQRAVSSYLRAVKAVVVHS